MVLANLTGATSPPDPDHQAENSRPERSKVGRQCIALNLESEESGTVPISPARGMSSPHPRSSFRVL